MVSHCWLPVKELYHVKVNGILSTKVETKSPLFTDALRPAEQAKIDCRLAHFDALGDDVKFIKATKMSDVEDVVYG